MLRGLHAGFAFVLAEPADARPASILRREQRLDRADHVANRPHGLELFRLDAPAGHFLKLDREIDCVDAVEIEFFVTDSLPA